jgi:cardiolipin-specific phospholipase
MSTQKTTTRGTTFNFTPLGYKQSFSQWWSSPTTEQAQDAILSFLPFYPQSDGKRTAKLEKVDIGDNLYLNEFEVVNTDKSSGSENNKDIVVIHGYGAGLGLFFQNFDAWSSLPNCTMHALDLLGFGNSARPKFKIQTKDAQAKDEQGRFRVVIETEDWFISSIEKWRIRKNIEKFTLVAHSMGGYLACAYAFKYPSRIEKLILISPAGVDRGYSPELEHRSLYGIYSANKNRERELMKEISAPEAEIEQVEASSNSSSSSTTASTTNGGSSANNGRKKLSTGRMLLYYMWNNNYSPFSIMRYSTFLGPRLISEWTYRRFSGLESEQSVAMHTYVYKIFVAKPSGEHAITRLLAPGALARMPLVDRVSTGLKCPSLWIYGDNDWMNVEAGKEAVEKLNGLNDPHTKAECRVVENAGHHTYLDNPQVVDKMILNFINS